jgi:regulator of sigma E protease
VTRGGPGDKSGLQAGDEFISLGGVPVCSREEVIAIIRKNPGRKVPATVLRAGKQISLFITPAAGAQGRIDALLSDQETKKYEIQHPTPLKQVATVIARTWDTLKAVCHPSVSGVSVKDLSGPPGILTMLAANVNADIRLALSFLVLLNINLALLNLLPLPVLDGGHIAIAAIELISRRSLPQKMLTSLTTTFALILLCLIVYVSYNDFRRWNVFSSMFQHKTVMVDEGAKK